MNNGVFEVFRIAVGRQRIVSFTSIVRRVDAGNCSATLAVRQIDFSSLGSKTP